MVVGVLLEVAERARVVDLLGHVLAPGRLELLQLGLERAQALGGDELVVGDGWVMGSSSQGGAVSSGPMATEPKRAAPDETPIEEVLLTERKHWHDGPPHELFKEMRGEVPGPLDVEDLRVSRRRRATGR